MAASEGTGSGAAGEAGAPAASGLERGTRCGRYVLLDRLGAGGMGVVYRAYDPSLDRKVALKLLRVREGGARAPVAHKRLVREARALARLSHPNVVHVYDIGVVGDDQVYLAMEYVEGRTLRDFQAEERPRWRQTLALYLQAAEGLAAAHRAGLVHRDFKPDNVLLGRDGRVLVLDFGLAVHADAAASSDPAAPTSEDGPEVVDDDVTPTPIAGAAAQPGSLERYTIGVIGTPMYMSPEQLVGCATDARSDQYSFCVALYEALYGQLPFEAPVSTFESGGATASGSVQPNPLDSFAEAKKARVRRSVPTRSEVPANLRQTLDRGLAADPGERFLSMEALIAALRRDPTARRRRALLAVGALSLLATAGGLWQRAAHQQAQVCQGAERQLAGIWDPARRQAVARAFGRSGLPYAGETLAIAERALDEYAGRWVAMQTSTCQATRIRHAQSEELFDLRMSCLQGRLAAISAQVDVFASADAKVVEKATTAVRALPSLQACADVVELRGVARPPADAQTRSAIAEVERKLQHVAALARSGRYAEALGDERPLVAAAARLGYPPLRARVLVELADLQEQLGEYDEASQAARQALRAAQRGRDEDATFEALLSLARQADHKGRIADGQDWTRDAGERLAGTERPAPERTADLEAFEANWARRTGRYAEVIAHAQAALALYKEAGLETSRGPDLFLIMSVASGNLARIDESVAFARRAIELGTRIHGADHPIVGTLLARVCTPFVQAGLFDEAITHLSRGSAILDRTTGTKNQYAAAARLGLGQAYYFKHQYAQALEHFARARPRYEAISPEHPSLLSVHSYAGLAQLALGRRADAAVSFELAIQLGEKSGPEFFLLSLPLTGLGRLALAERAPARAVPPLERALAIRRKNPLDPVDFGENEGLLARALLESAPRDGKIRVRAMALARDAQAHFAQAGARAQLFAPDVDAWVKTTLAATVSASATPPGRSTP